MRLKLMDRAEKKVQSLKANMNSLSIDEEIRGRRLAFSKIKHQTRQLLTAEQFQPLTATATRSATTGKPRSKPSVTPVMQRLIYSAQNKNVLPGKLIRKEGSAKVKDVDVNNAYDFAGATWNFYYAVFGRNSLDNAGMKLIQTVHYQKKYENAMWDGTQMIYGDGDGKIFGSFVSDIDITGHEMTHGVVQYECNLEYKDQSGALNESLADVFGIMIKQKALNQDVKQSNWLIGENTVLGKKYAIRSLAAPGKAYVNHPELGTDPQPSHMSQYTNDPTDNGGVHLNSGITNHAFYLAAVGVGGFSWEKVGRVWYAAMCNKKLVPVNASFEVFKNATIAESTTLFGANDKVTSAIKTAWAKVGL